MVGSTMFEIGNYVAKANAGVCVIEDIIVTDLGSGKKTYYVLQPIYDCRSKLYVNIESTNLQLRYVMTKEESDLLLGSINDSEILLIDNVKERELKYKEALKSNNPTELLSVIKTLYHRGNERMALGKKKTVTDERYLKAAEMALYSELAFAMDMTIDEIKSLVLEVLEG